MLCLIGTMILFQTKVNTFGHAADDGLINSFTQIFLLSQRCQKSLILLNPSQQAAQ